MPSWTEKFGKNRESGIRQISKNLNIEKIFGRFSPFTQRPQQPQQQYMQQTQQPQYMQMPQQPLYTGPMTMAPAPTAPFVRPTLSTKPPGLSPPSRAALQSVKESLAQLSQKVNGILAAQRGGKSRKNRNRKNRSRKNRTSRR